MNFRIGSLVLLALLPPLQAGALSLVMSVRSNVNDQLEDAYSLDGLTGTVEINLDHISITGGQCRPIYCGPGTIIVEGFNLDLGADSALIRLGDSFSRTVPITSYLPFLPITTLQGQTLAFRIETPPVPPVPDGPDYLYRQQLSVAVPTFGNFTTEYALEAIRSGVVGGFALLNSNVDEFDHDVAFPIQLAIDSATLVPEPGTALLFGLGLGGLSLGRRRCARRER